MYCNNYEFSVIKGHKNDHGRAVLYEEHLINNRKILQNKYDCIPGCSSAFAD